MLHSPMILTLLTAVFGVALVLGVVRMFTARTVAAKVDSVVTGLTLLVLVAVIWGSGKGPVSVLEVGALVCFGVWFAVRVVLPGGPARPPGHKRFAQFYRMAITVVAIWFTVAVAKSGMNALHHPSHMLGTILVDLIGALALVVAAIAWLLATFAMPAGTGEKIRPIQGIQEGLIAVGMATCLYAIF